jgi:two-component system sensor kinase FixL
MIPRTLESKSFKWLFDAAADAMIIVGPGGGILLANPPVGTMFGYTPAELEGQSLEILIPERFRTLHTTQRSDYLHHPHNRPMGMGLQLYGRRKDGAEFAVDVSLSPLQIEGETMVMATIHDITRRKLAEDAIALQTEQLRESAARMRAVFETVVDGIVVIDAYGIIDRLNPGAERMFGYAAEELTGKNVSVLMPSPDREAHDGYLQRYLQSGEKRIIGIGREVLGRRRDGSTFPMELAVGEMNIGGQRMFTGMVRDITERKRMEQRQTALLHELEAANEELKNFAYAVSHDLKAPLRAIGSLADWIETDYADRLDAEGKEHLRLLTSRVHRMDALIDGILLYSRVGRVKEALATVDLAQLLHEVIDSLAPPPHITVTVEGAVPTLTAEPTRIRQLFQNLISNAIKYMDKRQGEVRIACVADGNRWKFSVADNGPGIEKRHFDRIFQLFQTLAPRDRVESTGVGLALVKKIVEMYGGRVWVESTPGQGSTFFFTLPRTQTTTKEPMP